VSKLKVPRFSLVFWNGVEEVDNRVLEERLNWLKGVQSDCSSSSDSSPSSLCFQADELVNWVVPTSGEFDGMVLRTEVAEPMSSVKRSSVVCDLGLEVVRT